MKILVTGGNGFLGSNFCLKATEAGDRVLGTFLNSRFSFKGCESRPLDIRDQEACLEMSKAFEPEAIIHCARYTVGVGQSEKERETLFKINTIGTRNMARSAERLGAVFVYISTDWIFSGKKPIGEKYKEEDDPCPLNYYGFTKWAGEEVVAQTKTNWLIVRPANIYGVHALFLESPRRREKEALGRSSWTHKMVTKLQQGEKIYLPDTMYQSPVLANHLAEVTLHLVKEKRTGIFHVAGRDGVSRYQFMRTAVEIFGLDPDLVLKGTLKGLEESWEVPQGLTGILPINACLDVEKVEKTSGIRMKTLREGLSEMKNYTGGGT